MNALQKWLLLAAGLLVAVAVLLREEKDGRDPPVEDLPVAPSGNRLHLLMPQEMN